MTRSQILTGLAKRKSKMRVSEIEHLIKIFGAENITILENGTIGHKPTIELTARVKELESVIDRLGTILSEEYGDGETDYEDELNHLLMKKTPYTSPEPETKEGK